MRTLLFYLAGWGGCWTLSSSPIYDVLGKGVHDCVSIILIGGKEGHVVCFLLHYACDRLSASMTMVLRSSTAPTATRLPLLRTAPQHNTHPIRSESDRAPDVEIGSLRSRDREKEQLLKPTTKIGSHDLTSRPVSTMSVVGHTFVTIAQRGGK